MKNAHTVNSNVSALEQRNYTSATLPRRINTMQADVLADFLDSKVLTGMESVFQNSTTRLAAVVYALNKRYGFEFESQEKAVGTKDGRTSFVSEYWLSPEAIQYAFKIGGRRWITSVRIASAKRRLKATECKLKAMRLNAKRRTVDPRQIALWG